MLAPQTREVTYLGKWWLASELGRNPNMNLA